MLLNGWLIDWMNEIKPKNVKYVKKGAEREREEGKEWQQFTHAKTLQ